MGFYSWCTSDTHKSIAIGEEQEVYLLNPFGKPYKESNYDGYGHFGGVDVFSLIAKWNKPELCKDENGEWLSDDRIRTVGIDLACYDKDHVQLKYPIKIVEHLIDYDKADISPSCPHQGYFYPQANEYDTFEQYNEAMVDCQDEIEQAFIKLNNTKHDFDVLKNINIQSSDEVMSILNNNDGALLLNEKNRAILLIAIKGDNKFVQDYISKYSDLYVVQELVKVNNLSKDACNNIYDRFKNQEYIYRWLKYQSNFDNNDIIKLNKDTLLDDIALNLTEFAHDYDLYGFDDSFSNYQEAFDSFKNRIITGNTDDIIETLDELIKEDDRTDICSLRDALVEQKQSKSLDEEDCELEM